jgi:hypothetical protein
MARAFLQEWAEECNRCQPQGKIYRFDNGFGASVVQHRHSYGGDQGLWELAVVRFTGEDSYDWSICYTTGITDDVIGRLSDGEVEALLDQIKALPEPNAAAA